MTIGGTSWFSRFALLLLLILLLILLSGAASAEPKHRILGLGDSLMAGYGLAPGEGFPARLQAALRAKGIDAEVIDAGVSGDTSAGGRARLSWSMAAKPTAAIIELGANDGLRGLDPEETYRNLSAILIELARLKIPALLAGMQAPPNLGQEYGGEFAAVYRRLAAEHSVVFYPFYLEGVAGDPALNLPDGMHPTATGIDVIVSRMLPSVRKLLDRTAP